MGEGALQSIWDLIIPKETTLHDDLPSLVGVTGSSYLFGYKSTYAKHGLEPAFAGSVRVIMSGSLHVLVFRTADLIKFIRERPKVGRHKASSSGGDLCDELAMVRDYVKDITAHKAAELKTKVQSYFGKVEANDGPAIILIPAGVNVSMLP
eukprot:10923129-Alexandrium_andersonii.AAC.1